MMAHQFDVIVVGAGTAGSVLADRLSASGRHQVLLLEAGGKPDGLFVQIPLGFPKVFKTKRDWAFETEPQSAVHDRRIFAPRGKMLGGSANINAMMHQWCHPEDFDSWARGGASGWQWDQVRPVFEAMERWEGEPIAGRGSAGPMRIQPNHHARALTHAWVSAARACGLGDQPGYNGTAYKGAWVSELAVVNGRRFSAFDAFLKPAMQRTNLHVRTDAQVLGLVCEGSQVVGVRYRHKGTDSFVRGRAVVLAAGAYGSPQLMMLSGIGPSEHLQSFGIPVRHALPGVGAALQDHPVLPINWACRNTDTLRNAGAPWALLRWLVARSGLLASGGVEGLAFTHSQAPDSAAADLEILFMPIEFRKEFLEAPKVHGFSMGSAVVAPRSRGTVRLRSANPLDAPRIDPALLSDPDGHDAAVLWAGIELARRIAKQEPLARWNAGEIAPGADIQTAEQLRRYAGETLQTVYHPTSTCRMGTDNHAVVSPALRVRGLGGLWVADASVMPSVPRGHPNAVVAMIAERASGWIDAALRP